MDTIKDRILQFIKYRRMSIRAFETAAGLSNGYVAAISDQSRIYKLENIFEAFPELSRKWVMTGDGNMLTKSDTQTDKARATESLLQLTYHSRTIELYQYVVESLLEGITPDLEPVRKAYKEHSEALDYATVHDLPTEHIEAVRKAEMWLIQHIQEDEQTKSIQ